MCSRSASLPRTWSLSRTCSVKPGASLQREELFAQAPDSFTLSNAACSDLPPARVSRPCILKLFKRLKAE